MDIKFVRDDTEKEREKQFKEIQEILKRDAKQEKNLIIGERFIKALFLSAKTRKFAEIPAKPQIQIQVPKPQRAIYIVEAPKEEIFNPINYTLLISPKQVLAKVLINKKDNTIIYNLTEPEININLFNFIEKLVAKKIIKNNLLINDIEFLTKNIKKACEKFKIQFDELLFEKIKYYLYRNLIDFFELYPLMHDQNITLIICNGPTIPLLVEYKNLGKITTNIILQKDKINLIIKRFADKTDTKIDHENPILNIRYEQFRVQANFNESRFIIKPET